MNILKVYITIQKDYYPEIFIYESLYDRMVNLPASALEIRYPFSEITGTYI